MNWRRWRCKTRASFTEFCFRAVAESLMEMAADPKRMKLHAQFAQNPEGCIYCCSRLRRRLTGNHPVICKPRELIRCRLYAIPASTVAPAGKNVNGFRLNSDAVRAA